MRSSKQTEASIRMARRIWADLSRQALSRLREITEQHKFSIAAGDLTYLENGWYVKAREMPKEQFKQEV